MKNIYLVQPTTENVNIVYFPYAIGCLTSYAWSFEDIRKEYTLKESFFLREPIEAVVERIEKPFLVGFSCYLWNFEYNKALAKSIKAAFPDCLTVFGGPQIPANASLLEECEFIDILQHYEGEVSFRDMLRALASGDSLHQVHNISYRVDSDYVTTPFVLEEEFDFPSPYQTGYFDDLIQKNPEITFEPMIETNRGCPHKCAYCSWSTVHSKIRQFPIERVFADLEWCAAHKTEFIGIIDANFGMFERDEIIVDKLIELKNKTGYPKKFQVSYVSYSKDSWERVFRITKKLRDNDMDKGVTLSFQSISPVVQKNIGRSNMNAQNYKKQFELYYDAGIPTYTELIMGLPGESFKSFQQGIEELLEMGQHTSLIVHLCEWLPLARIADPVYMQHYGVQYTKIPLSQPHAKKNADGITEYSRIITSTAAMSNADWIKTNLFSTTVLCFHYLRLLQFPALYIHHKSGVKYIDFYTKLSDYLLNFSSVFHQISELFHNVIEKQREATIYDETFGDIAWAPEEYVFLKLVTKKDWFYEWIKEFLRQFIKNEAILKDLLEFQSFCIKEKTKAVKKKAFSFHWKEYFTSLLNNQETELLKKRAVYCIQTDDCFETLEEYAKKVVWFGRHGGATVYFDEVIKQGENE